MTEESAGGVNRISTSGFMRMRIKCHAKECAQRMKLHAIFAFTPMINVETRIGRC